MTMEYRLSGHGKGKTMVSERVIEIFKRAASASFFVALVLLSLIAMSCGKKAKDGSGSLSGSASHAEADGASSPQIVYVGSPGGLFLRAAAQASSAKIAFIPYGESMALLAEGHDAQTIGEATGHWLNVDFMGTAGWVFGGFVSRDQPPMATISGQAVAELYGYDRIGAYNLDTRRFYAIENHAKPFIGGIEDPDISDADMAEISERITRDNEEACHFEIGGLPAGRYSVYTWASRNPLHSLAYMEKGSYDPDAREAQEVTPAIIELGSSGEFPEVSFEASVYFYCGGLPGQFEPLPLAEPGDFSLVADACRTTRPTRLFSEPYDFQTGKAMAGGKELDLEAGDELRVAAGKKPLTCGYKTLVAVTDGAGKAWWADAFDLAVGFGFYPPEDSSREDGLRDAVFILGRSGNRWIFRRLGTFMLSGSSVCEAQDPVPGATLVAAGIMLESRFGGFEEDFFTGEPDIFIKLMDELSSRDQGADGVAEFKEYLLPYLE
jgi:hypothetical protein